MFKMGCSMARKILASSSNQQQQQQQQGSTSDQQQQQQQTRPGGKAEEINDFSKLEQDPRIPLNVRQIFKITKSWKAIARTMSKTGTAMFLNLFEQNQDLFYLFDRFQHLKGRELHESMELREHAATVMSTLDQSINSLSDYDNFVTYLHSIGELHRKVPGFKREHFWKIEQPFMKAIKQTLDERCNETIEEIYKIAIKLIIETIADGYGQDGAPDLSSIQHGNESTDGPSSGAASGPTGTDRGSAAGPSDGVGGAGGGGGGDSRPQKPAVSGSTRQQQPGAPQQLVLVLLELSAARMLLDQANCASSFSGVHSDGGGGGRDAIGADGTGAREPQTNLKQSGSAVVTAALDRRPTNDEGARRCCLPAAMLANQPADDQVDHRRPLTSYNCKGSNQELTGLDHKREVAPSIGVYSSMDGPARAATATCCQSTWRPPNERPDNDHHDDPRWQSGRQQHRSPQSVVSSPRSTGRLTTCPMDLVAGQPSDSEPAHKLPSRRRPSPAPVPPVQPCSRPEVPRQVAAPPAGAREQPAARRPSRRVPLVSADETGSHPRLIWSARPRQISPSAAPLYLAGPALSPPRPPAALPAPPPTTADGSTPRRDANDTTTTSERNPSPNIRRSSGQTRARRRQLGQPAPPPAATHYNYPTGIDPNSLAELIKSLMRAFHSIRNNTDLLSDHTQIA